jgi:TetR/AcrR family transcriptional regulator, transcriptional repressor for nem operon
MRIAEFDREQVLRSAMAAFVANGYGKTSMQDLKRVTGLHPGSIYCAFENKRGLLLAALEHYAMERSSEFDELFAQSDSIMAGFDAYFAQIIDECQSDEIRDCLLQKALSELSQQDEEIESIISIMLKQWELSIADKLEQAQQLGEIDSQLDCKAGAEYLVMGIYGIRTFSHTHPQKGSLARLAQQLLRYFYT